MRWKRRCEILLPLCHMKQLYREAQNGQVIALVGAIHCVLSL